MPPTGLGKMYFSREDSCISHYLLCISLLENTKFPTKWSHFPGRRFLISTFFPTMSSNGRDNDSVGKYDCSPLSWDMQRFSLLQQGDLVKIHLVALLSQVGMWSNTTGIFNMLWKWDMSMIIIWLWSRWLQMLCKSSGLKVA